MIKIEVNRGKVDIKEAEGNGFVLMSELCCIVKAICSAFCENEPDSKEMQSKMILSVAEALVAAEDKDIWEADLEDD